MRCILPIFLFAAWSLSLHAQTVRPDTVLNLDEMTVPAERINRFVKGQHVQVADSLVRSEAVNMTLADLVSNNSTAYIRNYGQGTLATLSIRGTSANHTSLLWNGIRIAPPNIGYQDLSLIQQNFFPSVMMLYGGASPMFGSGAIGGSIHLEGRPVFSNSGFKADAGLSFGSFTTAGTDVSLTFSGKKLYARSAGNVLKSRNDFPYTGLNGKEKNLEHAGIFRAGAIQDLAVLLPGRQYLMASGWFQAADRNIPPTLTTDTSAAVQNDRSVRMMLIWKDFNNRNSLEAKLAYFNDYTRYADPLSDVFSTIVTHSAVAAFESTWELGEKSALFAGTSYSYEFADLLYYPQPEYQQVIALYTSYRLDLPADWQTVVTGRQELLSDYITPFVFSLGAEGKIWKMLSGRISISRNFRAPTMNERFWQPGGNPDIEPEKSWNGEAGLVFGTELKKMEMNFDFTFFNSLVNQWILWIPGNNYWSVENAQQVWSRGIEMNAIQKLKFQNFGLYFSESYALSKSTNQKKLFEMDASYKKQLIYTPVHRLLVKGGLTTDRINLAVTGNFTGKVYTSKDNQEYLPSHFLLDAVLSTTLNSNKKAKYTIQLNLNNLLNKEYEVVPYRPMPGFNFLLGLKLNYN